MSETKHNYNENKDKQGQDSHESKDERETKIIPISNEVAAEITFIEVNGERWIKEKQLDSYRTALKKNIEEEFEELPATREKINKIIDQTTIEK